MQRKFLEDLGLEKEVIDKIMTENGNDVNNAKKKLGLHRRTARQTLIPKAVRRFSMTRSNQATHLQEHST